MTTRKLVTRSGQEWEQIVMGEVLIPDTPNVYGDIYTEGSIREFAREFMIKGLNSEVILDIEHDNEDITGQAYIVESFIARAGDTEFIPGSWVISVWIKDPDIWQLVLDGELNGFSYEALCGITPVLIKNLRSRIVTGITAPDPLDGHTHSYSVVLDALNRPLSGGTGETDGHTHDIRRHTITEKANGHTHRFDVLTQGESK